LKRSKQLVKETARQIPIHELPKEEQFQKLSTPSKHLIETIKLIAYRAETAMANLLRDKMKNPDESWSLLRMLYTSDTDLLPDENAGTLSVRLHHMANECSDTIIEDLCVQLNTTKTKFPGKELRLVLKFGSK
jgi:hypothetical protein